jgi:hypothetical protein
LSATWLHAGLLHIVFNMLAVRNIGPLTVDVIGPARTVIIYVVSGACGFLLSSVAGAYFPPIPFLHGAPLTVGASASILGLIGALVHYGQRSGSSMIHTQAKQWALMAHEALGCSGLTRADLRWDDSKPGTAGLVVLELNTQPGMTPLSLAPEQAKWAGISWPELMTWMVDHARHPA